MFNINPRVKVGLLWALIHAGIFLYVYTLMKATGSLKCAFWFCATSYFNIALYGIILKEKLKYTINPIIADIRNALNRTEPSEEKVS